MKLLVSQPLHGQQLATLKKELATGIKPDYVLYPEGSLANQTELNEAKKLAQLYQTTIITSYRQDQQDWPVVINHRGEISYERSKTKADGTAVLVEPLTTEVEDDQIGFILCMEILKGLRDFKSQGNLAFIAHPIGVGMFSEAQLSEWLSAAQGLALKEKTFVIGTSHGDGSYKNCGISIPLSYCIQPDGELLYLAKNDLRSRIVDLTALRITIIEKE